jgi:hypothetical protein
MSNQVSLMDYLQHGPIPLPVVDQGQSPHNERNDSYSFDNITSVGHWAGFNLTSIQQQYGAVLAAARIQAEGAPSPPDPITAEGVLRLRIAVYPSSRVRRALRCGFTHMNSTQQLAGLTIVKYDGGEMAATPDNHTPDLAFFEPSLPEKTRPNRAPGVIKP